MRTGVGLSRMASLLCLLGCTDSGSTVSSAVLTPPPPPAPMVNAVLAVSNFTLTLVPPTPTNPDYYYNEKFLLTETSGKSGATIQNILSMAVGTTGGDNTGPICWRDAIRVEPGKTNDTFDAGWDALGYCAPFTPSRTPLTGASIIVTFTDDEGHTGMVQATSTIVK